ncbi:MAG: transglycosylase domain-containing protein, partial [Armatimonadetes bacterium]|nr:transglycosylase domain-containing protein [Armatimonadota bacterium]
MSVAASTRTRKRRRPSRIRQFLSAIQLVILSVFAVGLVFTAVTIWNLSTILPQGAGTIGDMAAPESTKILSADGHVLATIFMDENREYVPLDKIPKNLRNATIATEDKRFYEHNGVDFRGIGRALVEDIRSQSRAQGGSTITQQLIRNVYLSQRKSIGRKIQEALLAIQIERKYSKDEILEKYLNQVFYGSGAYGVQAAARTYFGKKVWELDLAESALLAGLPQRPTGYSPYKNLKFARNRRNTVLALMAQEGYITEEQKKKAQAEPIQPPFRRPSGAFVRRAPSFVDYILDD